MHPTRTPRDHPSKGKKPSCGLFPSEYSSACQSGLHGRYKLEFCSQRDLDTHIECKDTLWGFASERTNYFNFCFPVAITVILFIVLVWDLFLPPTLGFSEAGWFSHFLKMWYFGLLYQSLWHPHWHQLFWVNSWRSLRDIQLGRRLATLESQRGNGKPSGHYLYYRSTIISH